VGAGDAVVEAGFEDGTVEGTTDAEAATEGIADTTDPEGITNALPAGHHGGIGHGPAGGQKPAANIAMHSTTKPAAT